MNIESVRKDFPMLQKEESSVYLDSAATSLTPTPVLEAMDTYYREYRSNIHRGLYSEAERASREYEDARGSVARFIGADTREVIFTAGATLSSNMLIYMLEHGSMFQEGDEIVTTVMEHNAVLLPLQALAKRKKLTLRYIELRGCELNYEQAKTVITDKTKLVALTLASNVLGTINDVRKIADLAHAKGAFVVVDATAGVGHMPLNVQELGADFLFFSGHKMSGPTGVGILYGKQELLKKLSPSFLGGGIVEDVSRTDYVLTDSPWSYEAGTPPIAGAIGLKAAIAYLESVGLEKIRAHTQEILTYTFESLKKVDGLSIISTPPEKNIGIVSFTFEGIHSHDVAQVLGNSGVAVRAGHHCALTLHKELCIVSSVRASMYLYTNKKDIDALVEGLKDVQRIFHSTYE